LKGWPMAAGSSITLRQTLTNPCVDELREAAAGAGQHDSAVGVQMVPDESFAIEIVAGAVDKRRAQSDHREADALVETEQSALTHGFVARVEFGRVVAGEGVAFVMIEAVAIGATLDIER